MCEAHRALYVRYIRSHYYYYFLSSLYGHILLCKCLGRYVNLYLVFTENFKFEYQISFHFVGPIVLDRFCTKIQ